MVRFKEGKRAAIFEADGGQWQVEAVRRVGAYLRERLKAVSYTHLDVYKRQAWTSWNGRCVLLTWRS